MSTKTTFKRVALVAVAALGLGVLSVAPSSAAPTIAYGVIADSTNGQGIVGGQATVIITLDTNTVTTVAVTGVGSVLGTTQDSTTVTGTVTSGSWSDSSTTAGTVNGTQTITLTSAVAGVTTITATPLTNGTGAPGTAVTKTVTWVAATSTATYDHANAFISDGNITTRVYADSTTAELTNTSVLSATPKVTINVTQFNAADTVTVTTLTTTATKAIVATISGAGAVGAAQDGSDAGASVTIAAGSATREDYVYVYADGRNGTGTITITVNGVAVATKTVSFTGTAKSYAMSATTGETLSKKNIAIAAAASGADAESATVTIKELDALGTIMGTTATTHVTSDAATIATAAISSGVLYIYGVGLGTTNINVCNTASCTSATIKLSIPITVVEKTAASYKVAFDAPTYAPGALVTWTLTATTKTGKPIADGSRAVIGTSTANMTAPTGHPTGALTFAAGVATGTFFAPVTTGDFTITTVEGAAVDAVIAGGTAVKTANTISIVNASADAATDAANEATDAANAATDAALAAADAADAATAAAEDASAAVATLAASVNTALANLKKQITALTALVNKLLKK
jgi:F0F1-type ATP synthase epsilon subunit